MAKTIYSPPWLRLLTPKHDFFELLGKHAHVVHQSFIDLAEWFEAGAKGECEKVHAREHEADRLKHEIEEALRDSFVTPFDREGIYDLCERTDRILTGAKIVVKDIEYFQDGETDEYLIEMCHALATGTEHLVNAIVELKRDLSKALELANETRKTQTELMKIYRPAMKAAYAEEDMRKTIRKKQLYDYMTIIADSVYTVGEKLVHLSIKNG